jgi:hypothetical protein
MELLITQDLELNMGRHFGASFVQENLLHYWFITGSLREHHGIMII